MNAEINEIIKKSLPAQVGEVLKTRLEQAEKDAEKVIQLDKKILEKNALIESYENTIEEYRAFDKRNSNLEAREKALSENQNKLEVDTLTYQLACEKDKTKFSQDVALGLVRNTSYRKNVFDNENGPQGTDQYGNIIYSNTSKNTTEEKTEE